jgi:hypothetical protein
MTLQAPCKAMPLVPMQRNLKIKECDAKQLQQEGPDTGGNLFFCETVWSHIPGSEPPVSVNHKMVL